MKDKAIIAFVIGLYLLGLFTMFIAVNATYNQWTPAMNFGPVPQPVVLNLWGQTLPVGQTPINQTVEVNTTLYSK